jgi:hypothetical protein
MAKLLTTYYVSITKYLVTLYRIWYLYHSYVRKAIKVKILWHHSGPFSSLLGHSSYFFKGLKPSLSGLTCCLRLFRMVGFDYSCINISFLVGWSPYSSWCNGTCRDQYLSLLGHIMIYSNIVIWGCPITCFAFQEFSSAILFWNAFFFDRPTTWAKIYFTFSRCSFKCCVNMSSLLCRSSSKGLDYLVLAPFHFVYPSPILLQHFVFVSVYHTSYNCTFFMMPMLSYHWWFGYPFVTLHVWEWVHYSPWYTSNYCCNYCIGEWNPRLKRGFSFFLSPHTKMNGYCHH